MPNQHTTRTSRAKKAKPAARRGATGGQLERLSVELAEKAVELEERERGFEDRVRVQASAERAFDRRLRRVEDMVSDNPLREVADDGDGGRLRFETSLSKECSDEPPRESSLEEALAWLEKAIDAHGIALGELEGRLSPVLRRHEQPEGILAGQMVGAAHSPAYERVTDAINHLGQLTERVGDLLGRVDL